MGEVMWPEGGWTPVEAKAAKAEKPPAPDVMFTVDAHGRAFLSVSASLTGHLGWGLRERLSVGVVGGETLVFVAVKPAHDGQFGLLPPPGYKADGGLPKRLVIRLQRLGGAGLAPGRRADVHVKREGCSLMVAVSRDADAPPRGAKKSREGKGARGDSPAAPAAKAQPPSLRGGFDFRSLVDFALARAREEWIGKSNDRSERIVAAVALVKLGEGKDAVREALGIANVLLPEIEDMPDPARMVAMQVFKLLEEAVGE